MCNWKVLPTPASECINGMNGEYSSEVGFYFENTFIFAWALDPKLHININNWIAKIFLVGVYHGARSTSHTHTHTDSFQFAFVHL